MAVKVVLRNIRDKDKISFELPSDKVYLQKINEILDNCHKNSNGYVSVEINRPYKPRTTGEGSQNNKFYALVTEIAKETGNDIEDVKDGVKERALKRGYPYTTNPFTGKIKPYSTTKINTVEMSYLIDECIQLCSELGIILAPELVREEPAIEENETQKLADELGGLF